MLYDVIIVGGGPSGLSTAAKIKNKKVLLLEKNPILGRKLLLSGNGQCNITHGGEMKDFIDHYGDHGKFLRTALFYYDNKSLLKDFEQFGINFVDNGKGKIFPEAMDSQVILDVMIQRLKANRVEIKTKEAVKKIVKLDGGFQVESSKTTYTTKHLVIATGGKTYQSTGSTGDGYGFAKSLDIELVKPKEALTPISCTSFQLADLMGLSFEDRDISLWRTGKKIDEFQGDLLITHKGFSGPVILNNSRNFELGDTIKINFAGQSRDLLEKWLIDQVNENPKKLIKTILSSLDLPSRLLEKVLSLCDVGHDIRGASLKKVSRKDLVNHLTEYVCQIKGFGGEHLAMVTSGGISLEAINKKTLQIKSIDNLYFIGEVIDIDGDTGGYNIQAAFSMGALCARSIEKACEL